MTSWTDAARERKGGGGQRLKLHHKSHGERKHDVTPPPPPFLPPFSIHHPRLRPGSLLPLLMCVQIAPWMDQVYFIVLLYVLQTLIV